MRELVEAGQPVEMIAVKPGLKPDTVRMKIKRLGPNVVVHKPSCRTTTSLKTPEDLPSVEEVLKILAAALKASTKSGLSKVEVQRLQVIATLARTYEDLLADYVNYREIEAKLFEMAEKYEKLMQEN